MSAGASLFWCISSGRGGFSKHMWSYDLIGKESAHGSFDVSGFTVERQPSAPELLCDEPSHVAAAERIEDQTTFCRQESDKEFWHLPGESGRVNSEVPLTTVLLIAVLSRCMGDLDQIGRD